MIDLVNLDLEGLSAIEHRVAVDLIREACPELQVAESDRPPRNLDLPTVSAIAGIVSTICASISLFFQLRTRRAQQKSAESQKLARETQARLLLRLPQEALTALNSAYNTPKLVDHVDVRLRDGEYLIAARKHDNILLIKGRISK
jgi:hypothetical protein